MTQNKLWTKDFTIITLGSVISMLGNSMAGFAVSLFVLDYTDTPFLYALFVFLYTLPQIVAPILAGPLMDRFSRRKTIYMLDFLSAFLYLMFAVLVHFNFYNFTLLAVITFAIGTINSVYTVAFTSFYPLLITDGNYSKAYSVSSTLETLTMVMIPIATFLYKEFGIFPLLIANSVSFFIAALFETRISDVETKNEKSEKAYSVKAYIEDSKEGVRYLFGEKGLMFIALYFAVSSLVGGASSVITLPWFRDNYINGEYVYMSVWVFMAIGRVIGGLIHYRKKIPAHKKFAIALFVYITLSVLEGTYLYTPLFVMRIMCFIVGILGVTSYNIRISATQSYVPNEKKGRFNGAFIMLTTVGALTGELTSGIVASFIPARITLSIFMGISALAAIFLIGGGKKHIEPIYNQKT